MVVPAERLHTFSFEDYVQIAERSDVRVEFWEGTILDMSGGSPRHSAICANVIGIVLVAQDRQEVTVHERRADGTWLQAIHRDGRVALGAIACELPLAEIYEQLPEA